VNNLSTIQRPYNFTPEIFVKSIWVSSGLAMMFTLPPLGVLIAIYWNTGNLLVAAVVGFTFHFVILGASPKLSNWLSSFMD
jgi:hypothetical protein